MSKRNVSLTEAARIMSDYLVTLEMVKGTEIANQTELLWSKGWFKLRPAGHDRDTPAIPYHPHEIEQMTRDLWKEEITI